LRRVWIGAWFSCVLLTAAPPASAQTAPPTPSPAPSPTATPTPPWTVNGFADVTYTTPLASGGTFVFTNGTIDRVFDGVTGNNTKYPQMTRFVPNDFNVSIRKNTAQGLGGQLEVSLGSDANVIASYGGAANTYTDVTQAFLYYATGPFTLNAGKFETLAGYEVIESPNDNQISRSILFGFAIPFTHTGLRLVFAPTTHFSLTAGGNFGWDQILSTRGLDTFEAGASWTPSTVFSLSADVYTGPEPSVLTPFPNGGTLAPPPGNGAVYAYPFGTITGTIYGTRTLADLVAHWNPTGLWNFGVNYDYAQQTNDQLFDAGGALVTGAGGVPVLGTAKWSGVAGYVVWNANPHYTLSGRLETFADTNGVRTGIAQTWNEGTLTLQYVPGASNVKLRAEYRYDWSNQPVFARSTVPLGTAASNNGSIAGEAIITWP
jgi:hypothetical protein